MIRGEVRGAFRARPDALMGFASGELGAPRTGYTDMIAPARITDPAVALIDR